MLFIYFLMAQTFADKSAFEQELESHQTTQTRERWVELNGSTYRQVEYEGKNYYMKFNEKDGTAKVDCSMIGKNLTPSLAEGAFKVTQRTKVFVSLLREDCIEVRGFLRPVHILDPRIGVTLPQTSKSKIKNKKVFIGPSGPGFAGEW